jgi:hypothetical protein
LLLHLTSPYIAEGEAALSNGGEAAIGYGRHYGLARRRMWLVSRAAFYGLSPEQMHRMDTAKRTPRYHYDVDSRRKGCSRGFRQPEADGEERQSIRRVEAIRRQLPQQDRRLLDLYLQENGNVSAVARRLNRKGNRTQDRYYRLFRRIAATA